MEDRAKLEGAPQRLLQLHRESIVVNRESLLANGRLCPSCSRLLAWPPSCPLHSAPAR